MTTEIENINTGDARRLLLRVYKKLTCGEITAAQASAEAYILTAILRSLESSGLDKLEEGDIKFKVEFK